MCRRISLALLLVLFFSVSIFPSQLIVRAQAAFPLELGYGPSLLVSVAEGTPVYSTGDQIWIRSDYNQTINVSIGFAQQTNNSSLISAKLSPGVPAFVHVFSRSDAGIWLISSLVFPAFPFYVANITASADLKLSSYGLSGGALALNFSTNPALPFYDAEACAMARVNTSNAILGVPGGVGGGQLALKMEPGRVTLAGSGLANVTFSFSSELYYSYSFLSPNSGLTFVSRNERVATSDVVSMSKKNASNFVDMHSDVVLRDGRYRLRAIFQGETGTYVVETRFLFSVAQGWVWLGRCQTSNVFTNNFRVSIPLGQEPSAWPTQLYLLYRDTGVEGFVRSELGINISEVGFVWEPWSVRVAGYNVTASALGSADRVDVSNGTVYIVGKGDEARTGYRVGLGNSTFAQSSLSVPSFSFPQVRLNVSRLVISYVARGVPVGGGSVRIRNANGTFATLTTDRGGSLTVYLPSGSYELSASGGNSSASENVTLAEGQSLSVTLGSAGTQSAAPVLTYSLAALAAIGVILNVFVVAVRTRRRRRIQAGFSPSHFSQ